MSRWSKSLFACRATTLFLAAWITGAILVAELGGVPHLYGWPLLVVRPEGFSHPHAWVWVVDLLGACVLLGATWAIAIRSYKAQMRAVRFRLATLLGIVAAIAVAAAVWRWSEDHLLFEVARFGSDGNELAAATTAFLDLNAFMTYLSLRAYLPLWHRPLKLAVQAGVLAGIGCAVYVLGCGVATFFIRRLRQTSTPSDSSDVDGAAI